MIPHKKSIIRFPSISIKDYIKSISGLVAYYPLDELSGNAKNNAPSKIGLFNGTNTAITQGVAGKKGFASSFNGTTSFVDFSTCAIGMTGNATFSAFCIINPINVISDGTIFMYGPATASRVISIDFSNIDGTIKSAHFSNDHNFSKKVSFNTWQMIGFTYNGTSETLYYNGVAIESWGPTALDLIDNQNMRIGKNWSSTIMGACSLQHIALYNSFLSSSQMLRIAQIAGLA